VPVDKLTPLYKKVQTYSDLPEQLLATIRHFFEHYKDLEEGKWVKVKDWEGPEQAKLEINSSAERYKKQGN